MRLNPNNPWETAPHHSSLVHLPTHSLWACTSGPIRTSPHSPLLIFLTGAGGPSAFLIKLQQHLSTFTRVLFYDRAGYNQSTLPPPGPPILASDSARDVTALLAATHLAPPYILAAHSYGGIIARTFLAQNPSVVAGMLLLDTATELMLHMFPALPPPELLSVGRGVDVAALTHLQRDAGMSDKEWMDAVRAQQRCQRAAAREDTHGSAHALALSRQLDTHALGDAPLVVVRCNMARDFQLLYDAGVARGDGTEEEREAAGRFIESVGLFFGQVARAQGGLSRCVEVVEVEDCGHDFPIRRPVVVGGMVRRLLGRVEGGKGGREIGWV